MEITFEDVAGSLEPLSQVTDAAFQEAQDASSFGRLLHVAHLTQEEDAFDDHVPFSIEPTCLTTPVNAVVNAIANDVQPPFSTAASAYYAPAPAAVAPITAEVVFAAAVQPAPPPSATTSTKTQTRLLFKKRKSPQSSGSGRDSSKEKKKTPTPKTPSTSTKGNPVASLEAPSTTTPRGVEAALIIDTIAKRVQDRPARDTNIKSTGVAGYGAEEMKVKMVKEEENKEEADENRHPEATKGGPQHPHRHSSTEGKKAAVGGGGGGRGGASRQLASRKTNAAATAVAPAAFKSSRRAAPSQPRALCNRVDNNIIDENIEDDDPEAAAAAAAADEIRRSKRATSEELEELKLTDPSKYKRIVGNRKSAANSKARKDATLRETKAECERLLDENRKLAAALEKFQKREANKVGGEGSSGGGGNDGGGGDGGCAASKSTKSTKPLVRRGLRSR